VCALNRSMILLQAGNITHKKSGYTHICKRKLAGTRYIYELGLSLIKQCEIFKSSINPMSD
jgi:hypothetical protein